jgi:sugar transferase EpsL
MKRAFDVVASSLGLLILSPVLAATAILVRWKLGSPVLFRQRRLGYLGRPFVLLKFRTMLDAPPSDLAKLDDERRLTSVGRVLRKTSLDELPTLINVVRGDLSIVGPRPLLPEYRDRYTPEQWRRHQMPPGIAGPAAAEGRNALTWDEKFALDVWYVDNWSPSLDWKLLVRSLWKVVKMEGISARDHATMPPFEGSPMRERGDDA